MGTNGSLSQRMCSLVFNLKIVFSLEWPCCYRIPLDTSTRATQCLFFLSFSDSILYTPKLAQVPSGVCPYLGVLLYIYFSVYICNIKPGSTRNPHRETEAVYSCPFN